jgi:hypothetical protein
MRCAVARLSGDGSSMGSRKSARPCACTRGSGAGVRSRGGARHSSGHAAQARRGGRPPRCSSRPQRPGRRGADGPGGAAPRSHAHLARRQRVLLAQHPLQRPELELLDVAQVAVAVEVLAAVAALRAEGGQGSCSAAGPTWGRAERRPPGIHTHTHTRVAGPMQGCCW